VFPTNSSNFVISDQFVHLRNISKPYFPVQRSRVILAPAVSTILFLIPTRPPLVGHGSCTDHAPSCLIAVSWTPVAPPYQFTQSLSMCSKWIVGARFRSRLYWSLVAHDHTGSSFQVLTPEALVQYTLFAHGAVSSPLSATPFASTAILFCTLTEIAPLVELYSSQFHTVDHTAARASASV